MIISSGFFINMKYDLLLLDADDTLFDYRKGEEFAFYESLNAFGIKGDSEYFLDQPQTV